MYNAQLKVLSPQRQMIIIVKTRKLGTSTSSVPLVSQAACVASLSLGDTFMALSS